MGDTKNTIALNCREIVVNIHGIEELDSATGKPLTWGVLLAIYVAQGNGVGRERAPECWALAVELRRAETVELSADDVKLVMDCLRGAPDIAAWVVGAAQEKLDPASLPERVRERLARANAAKAIAGTTNGSGAKDGAAQADGGRSLQ